MSVVAKLRKLRRMSADEVATRIREKISTSLERLSAGKSPTILIDRSLPSLTSRALTFLPGASQVEITRLKSNHPELFDRIARRCRTRNDQLARGEWKSLGFEFDFRGMIDWHRDPKSGYQFPRSFYEDVKIYELPAGGDAKYAWEPSRHQFLFELATNWAIAGDNHAAERVRDLLCDWIRNNPTCIGVNWTSALEVGMRVISWLWTLSLLDTWNGWKSEDLSLIETAIYAHAQFLSRHLSYYSSPYNHLIGEAAGLYLAGCLLGNRLGGPFRTTARRVLLDHSRRQFSADGFTVEQAGSYQFFTLGFLTVAREASRQFDDELRDLDPLLDLTWKAAAKFQQPDGRWSEIGDLDSARTLPVLPEDDWDFRGLVSVGAVQTQESTVTYAAQQPGEELYWLKGCSGVESFESLQARSTSAAACVLPSAGYAIGRSTEHLGNWALFDCGPISAGLHSDSTPSTAHGHADLLQLLFFANGQQVLSDSGIAAYAGDLKRVDWYRGAEAHNTFEVDGARTVRPAGRLSWSNAVAPGELYTDLNPNYWYFRGDYSSPENVTAERSVLFIHELGVFVADRVLSPSPRTARWAWHPKDPTAIQELRSENGTYVTEWGVVQTRISATQPISHCSYTHSKDGSVEGWKSPGFGIFLPGAILKFEIPLTAPETIALTEFQFQSVRCAVRFKSGLQTPNWPKAFQGALTQGHSEWLIQSETELLHVEQAATPSTRSSVNSRECLLKLTRLAPIDWN